MVSRGSYRGCGWRGLTASLLAFLAFVLVAWAVTNTWDAPIVTLIAALILLLLLLGAALLVLFKIIIWWGNNGPITRG